MREGVKKRNEYFTVRPTVSVDPSPLRSSYCDFLVFLTLYYDYICSEMNFTQELLESPIPPLTAAHLIVGGYF